MPERAEDKQSEETDLARRDRYGVARKKNKKSALFAPLSFLLVCVAVVFAMGVFFRVQTIEVEGSTVYTPEEIIDAAGIDEGDNLFFINQLSAGSRIIANLPRVENAWVERDLPNKIVIHVEESYALAFVHYEEQYWTITGACKLLQSVPPEELPGLIQVLAVSPVAPEAGRFMEVDQADELKLSYLKTILSAIEELDIVSQVSDLDMSNAANPTFRYQGRFTVRMGSNDNTDYKLRMLMSAVLTMEPDETGTFNLTDGVHVYFTPD